MKNKKRTVYVAVVVAECSSTLSMVSLRSHGDWAAFVGEDETEIVEKALRAQTEWEAKSHTNYRVLLGTLNREVKPSRRYTTYALKPTKI